MKCRIWSQDNQAWVCGFKENMKDKSHTVYSEDSNDALILSKSKALYNLTLDHWIVPEDALNNWTGFVNVEFTEPKKGN